MYNAIDTKVVYKISKNVPHLSYLSYRNTRWLQ